MLRISHFIHTIHTSIHAISRANRGCNNEGLDRGRERVQTNRLPDGCTQQTTEVETNHHPPYPSNIYICPRGHNSCGEGCLGAQPVSRKEKHKNLDLPRQTRLSDPAGIPELEPMQRGGLVYSPGCDIGVFIPRHRHVVFSHSDHRAPKAPTMLSKEVSSAVAGIVSLFRSKLRSPPRTTMSIDHSRMQTRAVWGRQQEHSQDVTSIQP